MPRKRKRRRLIVRRGRGETDEEPFLLSMVCVIFLCPFREKIMRGKSIRCSCSPMHTGVLQAKPGGLKKGEASPGTLPGASQRVASGFIPQHRNPGEDALVWLLGPHTDHEQVYEH